MRGIKRTAKRLGIVVGHRKGINGTELLTYGEARKLVYVPSYLYVLENLLHEELRTLSDILKTKDIVFLDYETNPNIDELKKPLSHASLIADFIRKQATTP
jgi:hypothetical protein